MNDRKVIAQISEYERKPRRHPIADMIHRIDSSKLGSRVVYYDTDSIYVVGCTDDLIAEYNAEIAKLKAQLPPECWDLGLFDKIGKTGHYNMIMIDWWWWCD